jgi:putative ABC transport system permease protein
MLLTDLRGALRSLLRAPGFTLVAVVTLALGIGANSAIFTVVNALLVRPLPYPDADRLMQVWETRPQIGRDRSSVSPAEFLDWRERSAAFDRLAAIDYRDANLTGGPEPETVSVARVSADWFPLFGLRPALGRFFGPEEDRPEHDRVVVLTHALWERRFGGDPAVVGTSLLLDGRPSLVVGVLGPGDRGPQDSALIEPIAFDADTRAERGHHYLEVLGRLAPGAPLATARAEMSALAATLAKDHGIRPESEGVLVVPLRDALYGRGRPVLLVLLGAVGLVLLIACANVAGLLLARAAEREQELAVRAALGATRRRLAQQRFAESLLLGIAGATSGLVLSLWGVDLLLKLVPGGIDRVREVGVDANVLLFTAATAIACGLLAGVAPALFAAGAAPALALAEGGRGTTAGRTKARLRSFLVAGQVALSIVLLVGAALLLRSFEALRRVDPGFATHGRIAAEIALPQGRYDSAARAAFFEDLSARLRSLPGVAAAGAVNVLPLSGSNTSSNYTVEGEPERSRDQAPNANRRSVAGEYFDALGLTLLDGRVFDRRDGAAAPAVVVVNRTFARRHWPEGTPLGRRMRFGSGPSNTSPWREVVGVVADLRHQALDEAPRAEVYMPLAQSPAGTMSVVVAASESPERMTEVVRATVRALDPDLPIANVRSMEEVVSGALLPQRLATVLVGAFAALALVLAALGLYGVVAYSVARRTQEIGVRIALGATGPGVLRLVVGQGMRLVAAGVAAGLAGAWGVTRLLASLLYGVSPTDPVAFSLAAVLLGLVALLAAALPAWRASRLDPMTALRRG